MVDDNVHASEVSPRSSGGAPKPIFAVIRRDGSVSRGYDTRWMADEDARNANDNPLALYGPYRVERLYTEAQVSALRQEAAGLREQVGAWHTDVEAPLVRQLMELYRAVDTDGSVDEKWNEKHAIYRDLAVDGAAALSVVNVTIERSNATARELSAARQEAETLRSQLAMKRDALIVGADWMAGAINRYVRIGVLDARSEAADAMLDYACVRHGESNPIAGVENAGTDPRAARVAAPREPKND